MRVPFLHVAVGHHALRHITSTMPRSCPSGSAKPASRSTSFNRSNPRLTHVQRHQTRHRPTNRRRRCRRPRNHRTTQPAPPTPATHPSGENAPCTHKPRMQQQPTLSLRYLSNQTTWLTLHCLRCCRQTTVLTPRCTTARLGNPRNVDAWCSRSPRPSWRHCQPRYQMICKLPVHS